jgi:phage shock protein PspC (stress-responsive transcriptional regulator)/two-component sensor histidine kinase
VAQGLADHAGLDPTLVRTAFVVLVFAGGLGVVLYLALALALPQQDRPSVATRRRTGLRPFLSVFLITSGLMLGARQIGFWFGDAFVGPVAIAAVGSTVLWIRSEPQGASGGVTSGPLETLFQGKVSTTRLVVGGLLITLAAGTFLAFNADPYTTSFRVIRLLFLPVLATVAGLLLIFGPWLYRLASQLTDERRDRIRSEERSALAAHLHDSVLQTLALIQRADTQQRMAHLARTQERELRAWLFGKVGALAGETLASALEALAGRCESHYPVSVEVVVVGDMPLDQGLEALTAACGEAMNNAAAHSGSSSVAVYAEVEPQSITVYVRDEGRGFEVNSIAEDRRGIKDSIEARLRRVGGTATVQSASDAGTEWTLTIPRNRS